MSWAEIKKAVNSDINTPLNDLINSKYRQVEMKFTADGSFIVPHTGEYAVCCIGHGGGHADSHTSGGGGGGAVAIGQYKLQHGDTIPITVNDTITSFGDYISATAGANASGTTGGAGGIATGGNIVNANGGKGGDAVLHYGSNFYAAGGGGGAGGTDGSDGINGTYPTGGKGGTGYSGSLGGAGYTSQNKNNASSGGGGGGFKFESFKLLLQSAGIASMEEHGGDGQYYASSQIGATPGGGAGCGYPVPDATLGYKGGGGGGGYGGGAGGSGHWEGAVTGGSGALYILYFGI